MIVTQFLAHHHCHSLSCFIIATPCAVLSYHSFVISSLPLVVLHHCLLVQHCQSLCSFLIATLALLARSLSLVVCFIFVTQICSSRSKLLPLKWITMTLFVCFIVSGCVPGRSCQSHHCKSRPNEASYRGFILFIALAKNPLVWHRIAIFFIGRPGPCGLPCLPVRPCCPPCFACRLLLHATAAKALLQIDR